MSFVIWISLLPILVHLVDGLKFNTNEEPATLTVQLLMFHGDKIVINPEAVEHLTQVQPPIRVISAIGLVKSGKSTTLNKIIDEWNGVFEDTTDTFLTSNKMESSTRGLWIHILSNGITAGSTIFIDAEGTGLGDDIKTTTLSIITGLMSSETLLLVKDLLTNQHIDFLYRVCHRANLTFGDYRNLGDLHVVVRGQLRPTSDSNEYGYTFLTQDSGGPNLPMVDHKRKVIKRCFPVIHSSQIPDIENTGFQESKVLKNEESYRLAIIELVHHLKVTKPKRTKTGGRMDGIMLSDLLYNLVEKPSDKWEDSFRCLEMQLCQRHFEKLIEPYLKSSDKLSIKIWKKELDVALDRYMEWCSLPDEIRKAQRQIEQQVWQRERVETSIKKYGIAKWKIKQLEKELEEERRKQRDR